MLTWLSQFHPVVQALLAGLFTWGLTALGAAVVFLRRTPSQKLLDAMLGFAAGVMIAASYWSLLAPSIAYAETSALPVWLPPALGFLLGAGFLRLADHYMPHLNLGAPDDEAEGVRTTWRRTTLLIVAMALHNIPEGLAIGVAFGAVQAGLDLPTGATLASAAALALGIGIQNFPEGIAVSMPLRREGVGRGTSFWYGQLSAVVEPVAAVLGAAAVTLFAPLLSYALAFAAGAMIFVVVEELIPAAHQDGHSDIATMGVIVGFTVMMILDVALG
ncbi:MAG: ZIP family metal transporter [Trueperaceae bacterium]|nr:ZIP family metal transporter [Trueperaceae bacterium]